MPHFQSKLLLAASTAAVLFGVGVVALRRSAPALTPEVTIRTIPPAPVDARILERQEYIRPIPPSAHLDRRLVALGKRLFHDTRLSSTGEVSCASCHNVDQGGDDDRDLAVGIHGLVGDRNSPTVLNSSFNFRQYWDGRVRTLEEQVDGPMEHPREMGMQWEEAMDVICRDEDYVREFTAVTGEGPTPTSVRRAIATFERSLNTPGSPFDRYLEGDDDAVSEGVLRGYEMFVQVGCVTCHQGVSVGGNMMQPLGRMTRYFEESSPDDSIGSETLFKVPSLRNVVRTAPYLHDGSVETLSEVVRLMSEYQLGVDLDDEEVADIVLFLESLDADVSYVD